MPEAKRPRAEGAPVPTASGNILGVLSDELLVSVAAFLLDGAATPLAGIKDLGRLTQVCTVFSTKRIPEPQPDEGKKKPLKGAAVGGSAKKDHLTLPLLTIAEAVAKMAYDAAPQANPFLFPAPHVPAHDGI